MSCTSACNLKAYLLDSRQLGGGKETKRNQSMQNMLDFIMHFRRSDLINHWNKQIKKAVFKDKKNNDIYIYKSTKKCSKSNADFLQNKQRQ